MQTSQAIARLSGPVFSAIGIGMLTNQAVYREMGGQFLNGYPFIYFSGILALVAASPSSMRTMSGRPTCAV